MILLILFAFVAGFVTILSPCILPVLPIVLSGSVTGSKKRPFGIVAGFIGSFTFFTLFLSTIVTKTGIPADSVRTVAILTLGLFGISMVVPQVQLFWEKMISRLLTFIPKQTNTIQQTESGDFWAGVAVGLSLGLLWTPCVGPILASVISLALTGTVTSQAAVITIAYALGTAIPLFAIITGGRKLLNRVPWLVRNTQTIQKGFGIVMIITALAVYFQIDRNFQTWIVSTFPSYGTHLTKIEDTALVRDALKKLELGPQNETIQQGKPMNITSKLPQAPEILPGGNWINSEALSLVSLQGKVVLVDFWTYTCINCIRTLPYIQSWHEKYKDKGLVIIGVHTPEFAFEKNVVNVQKAVADFGLTYPIVQDNDYATWRAYDNHYWPAKYFIDKNGTIRKTHFGEGAYDESEKFIQTLLAETGMRVDVPVANPTYTVQSRTPETYVGYQRLEYFASPEKIQPNSESMYSIPNSIANNTFAFGGNWMIGAEYALATKGNKLVFNFEAKNVYVVMRPTTNSSVSVNIALDGKPVSVGTAGKDSIQGFVNVDLDRLYHLISLPEAGRHILELNFSTGNIELFAFTFG